MTLGWVFQQLHHMLPQLCFTPQHCQLWRTPWQSRLWFGKIWLRVPTWANFLRVTWLKTDGPWWDLKRILCEVSLINRTSMHNYYQTPPDQSLLFTSNVFHISLKNMTLIWRALSKTALCQTARWMAIISTEKFSKSVGKYGYDYWSLLA